MGWFANFVRDCRATILPQHQVAADRRTLITPNEIARELVFQMQQNKRMVVADAVVPKARLGDRIPMRGYGDVVLDQRDSIEYPFKEADLKLSIDDYSEQFLKPAAGQFAGSALHHATDPERQVLVYAYQGRPVSIDDMPLAFFGAAEWQGITARVMGDGKKLVFSVLYGFAEPGG